MAEYTADQVHRIVSGLVRGRSRRPMSDDEWLRRTEPETYQVQQNRKVQEEILSELQNLVDILREQPHRPVGEGYVKQPSGTSSNPRGSIFTNVERRTNTDSG